jgi:putative membrane protein
MLVAAPGYLKMGWLHVKLMLVLLLIVYHAMCYKFLRDFAHDRRTHTAKWFRAFNEVPSLLLLGIVILAIVKPF